MGIRGAVGKCGVMCRDTGKCGEFRAMYGDTEGVRNVGSCTGIRGRGRKCGGDEWGYREVWGMYGDTGRCGVMYVDTVRCGVMYGGTGRFGECGMMYGDTRRCIWIQGSVGKRGVMCGETGKCGVMYGETGRFGKCGVMYWDAGSFGKCGVMHWDTGRCREILGDVWGYREV